MNRTTRYPDLHGWWNAYTRGCQMLVVEPDSAKIIKMYRYRGKGEIERRNPGKWVVSTAQYLEKVMTSEELDRRKAGLQCNPVGSWQGRREG